MHTTWIGMVAAAATVVSLGATFRWMFLGARRRARLRLVPRTRAPNRPGPP